MSFHEEGVSFSLEINVEQALSEIRKLQTVLYRSLGLMRQLGITGDLDEGIALIQKTIAALNALRLAAIAFYAASGPIGWALAIIGGVGAGVAYADVVGEMTSH
jgi:hypothetical protein